MKAIVLLGPPGAGKGTTAEGIKKAHPFIHVATGDMLRESIKNGTKLGETAAAYMKRGELVPDELIVRLVEERLDSGSPQDAYMFDGFPRSLVQAQLLQQSLTKRQATLNAVFFLDAGSDLLVERLSGRRTCRNCGTNYHVVNIPPKEENRCDRCGGELYQRPDDQKDTIANRLDVYNRQTESLISYFENQGILVRIDASRHRDLIIKEIIDRLSDS